MGAQEVTDDQRAGSRERMWANRLAPTLNQIEPSGGVDKLVWEKALTYPHHESRSASALVRYI